MVSPRTAIACASGRASSTVTILPWRRIRSTGAAGAGGCGAARAAAPSSRMLAPDRRVRWVMNSDCNRCGGPAGGILVGLVHLVEVDRQLPAVDPYRQAIHVARGAAVDEGAV